MYAWFENRETKRWYPLGKVENEFWMVWLRINISLIAQDTYFWNTDIKLEFLDPTNQTPKFNKNNFQSL